MSVVNQPYPVQKPPTAPVDLDAEPRPHRWTIDDYQKISDFGLLDQRTELLDGEIVEMPAQNVPHSLAISKISRLLLAAFDEEHFWVTIQSTVRLDEYNAPEPDFSVVDGPPVDAGRRHERPLLVIEVSDSTLLFDQIVKGSLYASRQIPDYWAVNVPERHVVIYREPIEAPSHRFGWRYASASIVRPPEFIAPLAKPDARIEVARMLP